MEDKPKCENCRAWLPIGNSGQGDCKRHAPATFEGALKVWPRTMYDDGCFDIIPKEKEVIRG